MRPEILSVLLREEQMGMLQGPFCSLNIQEVETLYPGVKSIDHPMGARHIQFMNNTGHLKVDACLGYPLDILQDLVRLTPRPVVDRRIHGIEGDLQHEVLPVGMLFKNGQHLLIKGNAIGENTDPNPPLRAVQDDLQNVGMQKRLATGQSEVEHPYVRHLVDQLQGAPGADAAPRERHGVTILA